MTFLTIQFLSDHTNLFTMVMIAALHTVMLKTRQTQKHLSGDFGKKLLQLHLLFLHSLLRLPFQNAAFFLFKSILSSQGSQF